jgi:lipopolysaccharide/colanic/teichoic acid biosynthesis glycosyltransferase
VTDVRGWYKDLSIAGVIFTELGPGDRRVVVDRLSDRLEALLSSVLRAEQLDELEVSFHLYPDDALASATGDSPLHPDAEQVQHDRRAARTLKRAVDIGGSLLALCVFSPVLLVVAMAIKLSSRGPVLFRQERIGLGGRRFEFLKFRSMYFPTDPAIHEHYTSRLIAGSIGPAAARGQKPVYKLVDDPRVTPLGRLLRRSSLDELPQLVNVLLGHMSLVGPRPSIPYEFDRYSIWHRNRLAAVRPGITGLWQISGRGGVRFDEMVRLDLRYARTWSTWEDLKILGRTVRVVLSGEGAY